MYHYQVHWISCYTAVNTVKLFGSKLLCSLHFLPSFVGQIICNKSGPICLHLPFFEQHMICYFYLDSQQLQRGSTNSSKLKIIFFVNTVAVAVNAIIGILLARDLSSFKRLYHFLKADLSRLLLDKLHSVIQCTSSTAIPMRQLKYTVLVSIDLQRSLLSVDSGDKKTRL